MLVTTAAPRHRVTMVNALPWTPIEDLPDDIGALEVTELRALDQVWREQRGELERSGAMKLFQTRLARAWAIETGVIERLYDLDRGATEQLIEHGLHADLIERSDTDKDPELVIRIIQDQRDVIEGLFDFIARRRKLSTSYVKELHAALTRSQEFVDAVDSLGRAVKVKLLHGAYKQSPNNPEREDGSKHYYCPPEQVHSEMDRLVEMHLAHEKQEVPPEVEAAFLHHRFTQIHPFQDGNGRVARTLASLVLLRAQWFPLTIDRDDKVEYIETLEAADFGNLRHLSRLIGRVQRQAIVQALGLGDQSKREHEGIDQILAAARDKVTGTGNSLAAEDLATAQAEVDQLVKRGIEIFESVQTKLRTQVTDYASNLSANVYTYERGHERAKWHRASVIRGAQRFHYYANLDTYAAWIQLRLKDHERGIQDDIMVALHGVGASFRGVIAAVGFWQRGTKDEHGWHNEPPELLSRDMFQVNIREDPEEARRRFEEWVTEQLTLGLAAWQRGLAGES